MEWRIHQTEDGSSTLYVPSLDETYHSVRGALTESRHVFIQNGLIDQIADQGIDLIDTLEVGFGTGLNAILTVLHCKKVSMPLKYVAIEPYPLPRSLVQQLQFDEILSDSEARDAFMRIHEAAPNETLEVFPNIHFQKEYSALEKWSSEDSFDLVYFDAFAPSKQPQIWARKNLLKVYNHLSEGGKFVTYSAQGQVRRDLRNVGFHVESRPGPPGKREITVAWKKESTG